MPISQTIIGSTTLPDGRIMEFGAKDTVTGQRFERILPAGSTPTVVPTEKQLPEEFATKALETVKSIQEGISEVQAGIKTVKPIEKVPQIIT